MKRTTVIMIAAIASCALPAAAQTPTRARTEQRIVADRQGIEALRLSVARVVRNAPYSAETVTEFVHSLADGNRIVRTTRTRVYRDSQGRTRVEYLGNGGEVTRITISDPVARRSYTLYPAKRVAYAGGSVAFAGGGGGGGRGGKIDPLLADQLKVAIAKRSEEVRAAGGGRGMAGGAVAKVTPDDNVTRQDEDLGERTIEGVMAKGTRTTTVIPAGNIGNELPIRIVAEQWHSPDLSLLVLTKHNDPQSGETTYRTTNIVRAEPDASLFQVPPDYKLEQEPQILSPVVPMIKR